MRQRWLGPLAILVAVPSIVSAQTSKAPRTPDGRPDLQGIWTNATVT
jgi:hypothetical protein